MFLQALRVRFCVRSASLFFLSIDEHIGYRRVQQTSTIAHQSGGRSVVVKRML